MATAIIKSSGREVPILVKGDSFFVLAGFHGGAAVVSGPYPLTDARFTLQDDEPEPPGGRAAPNYAARAKRS
jgi:hypothetical protein